MRAHQLGSSATAAPVLSVVVAAVVLPPRFPPPPRRRLEVPRLLEERLLESLLAMNHADGAHTDNPVPRTVSNLLVHVLGTHVDHVHDIVTRLEMDLDAIELQLDKGERSEVVVGGCFLAGQSSRRAPFHSSSG